MISVHCYTSAIRNLAFALILAGSPSLSEAQDALPEAAALLDRNIEATGGKAAWEKITSRWMTGTFVSEMAGHKLNADIEVHAMPPGKYHLVMQGDHISRVRVCDGENAWEWSNSHSHLSGGNQASEPQEQTELFEGAEKARMLEQARFHGLLDWRDRFKSAKTTQLCEVAERPAYEVVLEGLDGELRKNYFDKEKGWLVKTVRTIEGSQMGTIEIETFPRNYRQFDGVWIPAEIHQLLNSEKLGTGYQTWSYTQIRHNQEFSPKLFEMPDEVRNQLKGG